MAPNPRPYQVTEYVDDLYEDDPELDAWLDEQERLLERGELELVPDSEVRAMLLQMGVPISDVDPSDTEPRR